MRKKSRIVAWLLVTVLLLAVWPGGTFRTNAEELKTKENGDVVSDGTETAVDGTEEITVTAKDGVRVVNAVKEIPVYYDTDDAGNAGSNVETADAEGAGGDVDSPDNKDSADAGDREPSAEEGIIPEEKNTENHGEEPASARSVVLSEERAEDDHREGNAEGKKAKAEEKGEKKEEEEEEKKEEEGSDKKVDESKLPSGLDFSSCELLVGTKDRSLVEGKKELISEYDGVYLLHYDSEMDAKLDYLCFSEKADFVEVNETLAVSDEDPAVTGKSGEGAQDAISCMKELRSGSDLPERTIALIDTGVNAEGLVDAVSLTGGVDYDDHGHGTRMFRHIREEYPDARVLSVKAMDGTGRGSISDVYAGIQYAIRRGAKVINLSVSSRGTSGSAVIRKAVDDAVSKGIEVVGSAGNDGGNASSCIPGGIRTAVIVGACDANGKRLPTSNYGATVDYYVAADSTSEAAAKMSAVMARNDGTSHVGIFTPDYDPVEKKGGVVSYADDGFIISENDPSGGHTPGVPYVRRLARDGNTVLFGYYDAKGNYVDSDYTYSVKTGGKTYSLNTICIRFDWSPGDSDYEFDLKEPVEITGKEAKQLIYHVVHKLPYGIAHRVLCYWFGCKAPGAISGEDLSKGNTSATIKAYGSERISISGFNGTVDEFITKYTSKEEAIPGDILFYAYYLDSDSGKPASYPAYQDFLSWTEKKVEKKDYYVAVRKTDDEGLAIPGVTLDVAVNKDKKNLKKITTDAEGIADIYLGSYEEKPTVSVRERSDWPGASGFVVDGKWYGTNEGSGNISVYGTRAEARKNATQLRHTWKNPRSAVAFSLQKVSSDPGITEGNPNYSPEGAEYKMFLTEKDAGEAQKSGRYDKAVETFTMKADGTTDPVRVQKYMEKDDKNRLKESGTYFYLVESKAPKNFRRSSKVEKVLVKPGTAMNVFDLEDEPVKAGLQFLLDKVSSGNRKRSLSDAVFSLHFYPAKLSDNLGFRQLKEMQADESRSRILQTGKIMVDGKEYIGISLKEDYPLGYITLEEITAPKEYLLPDAGAHAKINEREVPTELVFAAVPTGDGATGYQAAGFQVTDAAGTEKILLRGDVVNKIIFPDDRIRGDLELRKTEDAEEKPVEGAVFQIENLDTHEIHRIVTDAEGYASTAAAYQPHDENPGYYDSGLSYDETKPGIWFREDPNDPDEKPDNKRGALISGDYRITEIDAAGLQLEEPVLIRVGKEPVVQEDGEILWEDPKDGSPDGMLYQIYDGNRKDGKKEITDMRMPSLATKAVTTDPEGGESESDLLPAAPDQTIYDICEYTNLRVDTDYTLVGTIMMKEEDGSVTPFHAENGEIATSRVVFHTKEGYDRSRYEACGSQLVRFDGLDFTEYEGRDFVIYEKLYLGDLEKEDEILTNYPDSNNQMVVFPLIHEDPEDERQTVKVPWYRTPKIVRTVLTDGKTAQHIANPGETVTFTDQVEYSGLIPRSREKDEKPYIIEGVLVDRESGKPILDEKKNEIRGWTEVYPGQNGQGIAEVKFTFHASLLNLEGKSVVCFEYLYDEPDGNLLSSHADLNDSFETVRFPKIGTRAADPVVTTIGKNRQKIRVTDHIYYENLPVTEPDGSRVSYIVRGQLMNPDGTVAKAGGKEITAELSFTPEKEKGMLDMEFPEFERVLRGDLSDGGFAYVVFEEIFLIRKDPVSHETVYIPVGEHKDIRSREQTVSYMQTVKSEEREKEKEEKKGNEKPQPETGDEADLWTMGILLLISALGISVLLIARRKRNRRNATNGDGS